MPQKYKISKKELCFLVKEEVNKVILEEGLKEGILKIKDKIFNWFINNLQKKLSPENVTKAGQNIEKQFGSTDLDFETIFNKLKSNSINLKESNSETTIQNVSDIFVSTVNKIAGTNIKAFGGIMVPLLGKLITQSGMSTLGEDAKIWVVTFMSSLAIMALAKIYNQMNS